MMLSSPVYAANGGNLDFAQGVAEEMGSAEYWKNKLGEDADRLLMTAEEIDKLNARMLAEPKTSMHDLENMPETYFAAVPKVSVPKTKFFIGGKAIDNTKYFTEMINAMKSTCLKGIQKTEYAVITKRVDMKEWPTSDILGYSADDTDDELQGSALNVNEPFVIRQKCVINGKGYYLGYSTNCVGWIDADCAAICASKQEWLDAWKTDTAADDFIVVTQDKITLEPSLFEPEISEVGLHLGTVLKLVPKDKIPANIGERNSWNNYTVYLPTRDENGRYVRRCALIPQHCSVSVGYLPLTQGNVLDTAFTCLGDRYGWGGMLGSMDCSMYTRQIYRCFGLEIPRNTTWQTQIPKRVTDLSQMSAAEKADYLDTVPVGTLLMFNGHITVYIGKENGRAYVISDTGSVAESTGALKVLSPMSVIITPLDVRRANGTTWLENVIKAVTFEELV